MYFLRLAIVLSVLAFAKGTLKCYSCISQGADKTCITNPDQVPGQNIVNCKYKYCTVRRYEDAADPDVITSFYRGCEDDPLPDGRNEGGAYVIWATSCQTSLCNNGDGINDGSSDNDGNGGNIIVVPGYNTASAVMQTSWISFLSIAAIAVMS